MAVTPITLDALTEAKLDGIGVYDVLMQATKAHLEDQYITGRIKSTEYAQVYLAGLNAVLNASIQFLLAKDKATKELELMDQQIALITQQVINAVTENTVLVAQECKLRAEFDLTMANVTRTNSENQLIQEKVLTERAQTQSLGVDDSSVIGVQKTLYQAQVNGYQRDAEQKATQIMVGTWNSRRVTDETTEVNEQNKLLDSYIGDVVSKLMSGINVAAV